MTERENSKHMHHHCPKKNMHRILIVKADHPDGKCPRCHEKVFEPNGNSSSDSSN